MKFDSDEIILKKSRANHAVPGDVSGGKLFLTNKRLFFKSHIFNLKNHEASIPLDEIIGLESKHSDSIPGKLIAKRNNGSREVFYLPHKSKWVEEIKKAKNRL